MKGLLICVVAYGGIACIVGCNHQPTLDDRIAEQEAIAKKLGWQYLPTQIKASLRVPSEENAAEDVKAALRTLLNPDRPTAKEHFQAGFREPYKSAFSAGSKHMAGDPPFTPGFALTSLEQSVKQFSPALDMFVKALDKPKWDFNRKLGKAYATLYPDLAAFKTLAKGLMTRAYLRGLKGDHRAVDDLKAIRKLQALLLQEPTLLSVLVGIALERIAQKGALEIAQANPRNRTLVLEIAQLWEKPQIQIDFRKMWCLELASDLVSIDLVTSEPGMAELGVKEPPADWRKTKPSRLRILENGNRALSAWKGEETDVVAAISAVREPSLECEKVMASLHPVFGVNGAGLRESTLVTALHGIRAVMTRERLIRIALLLAAQNPSGVPSLPAFAQKEPWLDPYTHMPFKIAPEVQGFTVYSLGQNGIDDFGATDDSDYRNGDIAIRFMPRIR